MHTAKHILTPRINMVPLRGHGIVNLWHCVPGQYCVGGALPCLQSCLMWAWFTRPLLSIEWLVGTWKPGPVARHVTSCWKPFKFWGWDLVACVCLALLCCDCNCNMCCVTMCMWRGSECWHVCCCLLSLESWCLPRLEATPSKAPDPVALPGGWVGQVCYNHHMLKCWWRRAGTMPPPWWWMWRSWTPWSWPCCFVTTAPTCCLCRMINKQTSLRSLGLDS